MAVKHIYSQFITMDMKKLMLKAFLRPVYSYISNNPDFKYSRYYLNIQDILTYNERERMMKMAMYFSMVSNVEGDYLEFGCCSGNTFTAAYHLAQTHNLTNMTFYAFDSFEGLPSITGVDAEGFKHFQKGEFAYSKDEFQKTLIEGQVDIKKVKIIPGWYNETLNDELKAQLPLRKAAVIWVDCDLYESTVPVLKFITSYIQDGTIIIFDDWFAYRGDSNRGEQKACAEWLRQNSSIQLHEFYHSGLGKSFIISNKC